MEDLFYLGIKALIRNREGKILLLKVSLRALKGTKQAYWDIPGGRIERGETVEQALKRELEEETGINSIKSATPFDTIVSNIRVPQKGGSDAGLILSIYICDVGKAETIVISEEHVDHAWFKPAEAAKLLAVKYPLEFTAKLKKL